MAEDSSTGSVSTISKSVRFAEGQDEVLFTYTRNEISSNEKQCLWYSQSEVEKIRSDLSKAVQSLRGKSLLGADAVYGVDEEVDVCARGIEYLLESQYAVRRREAAKVSLVRAILWEQKIQRAGDRIEVTDYNGAADDLEILAMLSLARSKTSVATARRLALEDAETVEEDLWQERKYMMKQVQSTPGQ